MSEPEIRIQVTRMAFNSRVFNIEFYLTKGRPRLLNTTMPVVHELEDGGASLNVRLKVGINVLRPSRDLETRFDKLTDGTWYLAQFDPNELPKRDAKSLDEGELRVNRSVYGGSVTFTLSVKITRNSDPIEIDLNDFDEEVLWASTGTQY